MKMKTSWLRFAFYLFAYFIAGCVHSVPKPVTPKTGLLFIDKGDSLYKAGATIIAANFHHPVEITSKYKITDSPILVRPKSQFHIPDFEQNLYDLNVPPGKKYLSQLNNGTTFCLNSCSDVIFHPAISKYMELTGEGFFLTLNDPIAIRVSNKLLVEASTNTEITITAYTDFDKNASAIITLLKGNAIVKLGARQVVLTIPGTQVIFNPASKTFKKGKTNIGDALAWRNSVFNYEDIDYCSLLQRICRWYGLKLICPPLETSFLKFSADFSEPLQILVDNINAVSPDIQCRLDSSNLVVQLKK